REVSGLWPLTLLVHTRHALLARRPLAMLARLDHLRQALPRHHRDPRTLGGQVLSRCSLELMLALGEVHRVQHRLDEHDQLPPWLCAAAARHHLITGRPRRAVRIAAAAVHRPDVHMRDRQDLATTLALAHRAQGNTGGMRDALHQGDALGRLTGNLQPLLEIPVEARSQLLAVAASDLTEQDRALVARASPLYPEQVELITLSPREREVLLQMRRDSTVHTVARSLSVSANTVKKQLTSVYAKLGVHDRSSALQRAHSLGLISDEDPT
ncbi:LuxR C-terminal-related transcriptional regulator, partial [Nocardioides sp.]|uniref:helix-turn-helix transcriptional regulator n=1 Tax=Nocardioides sp. TaxID=35761 RepID=UPI0027372225